MNESRPPEELAEIETERADLSATVPAGSAPARDARRSVASPESGEHIGRFLVREQLGRGGMGVVLSALDPLLGRKVAIKLVRPSAGSENDSVVAARLHREAQAMARLRHPNIVSVFEVGEHRGQVYIAMEQVEGGTLRDVAREMDEGGATDWRKLLSLYAGAGRGLAAAHAAGMVHRDFKPDNVFVDGSQRALVGDFGIVSRAGAAEESRAPGQALFSQAL